MYLSALMKKLLNVGVTDSMTKHQARVIVLTNSVALIAAALTTLLFFYTLRNGWSFVDSMIIATGIVLYSVLLLNRIGFINTSRFILTIAIPVCCYVIAFLPRIQQPDRFTYTQMSSVFAILLATSVIPILIFSKREKNMMLVCVLISFLFFSFSDILLRIYSKDGHLPTFDEYFRGTIVLNISYVLLSACVLTLKRIVDHFEWKNEQLIASLHDKNLQLENSNRELFELNQEFEIQNKEVQAQSEELLQGQENLMMAHREIERQKLELEKSLDEKSRDLMFSNQQLVTQNSELQQFSYTVSHNLRGPVASMLGLIHVYRFSDGEAEKVKVIGMIEHSAKSLETIIRDLNKIVDIRNDKFAIYENVQLEDEMELIKESLGDFISKNDVELHVNFQCEEIHSIKAYVNSILYNLVSNAIQYRSAKRRPIVKVASEAVNGHVHLTVTDNGLGIDLVKHGHEVFKLYKRFHLHTQGKGLGLYIVRQQIEKLNGKIEIDSKPDQGSTFKVTLPVRIQA
jgi:signal transduction histidine kinase